MTPGNIDDLRSPPSVEAPPPSAGPDPSKGSPQKDPHYRTSDEECFACRWFQDPNVCLKGVNGGQTEPGAGCDLFEKSDQDGGEGGPPMPAQGAPPPSSGSMLPQGPPQQ